MILLHPQLETFVAIVQWQTVNAAAKELGITQTAATQRILSLETRLGVSLFVRSRRGMQLTKEGEGLLRYCKGAVSLEGETLSWMQGQGIDTEARLTIASPTTPMRTRVIPSCSRLLKEFPQLRFSFDVDDTGSLIHKLKSGQADLVIVAPSEVTAEMQSKMLRKTRYILVGPRKWKGRPIREIVKMESIIDFNPGDTMTLDYLKEHHLAEYHQGTRHFVNLTELMATLVNAGAGYTVLSDEVANPLIAKKQVIALHPGKFFDWSSALAWYPRVNPPAYFKAILNSIH